MNMNREPLPDYRIYLTVDPARKRVVDTKHFDMRPDQCAKQDGTETTEKEIVIRVQKKGTGKPK